MKSREVRVKEEIRMFFDEEYDIHLDDSPQILDDYLYLEYYSDNPQVKLRLFYRGISKEEFLDMRENERNRWIIKTILNKEVHNTIKN